MLVWLESTIKNQEVDDTVKTAVQILIYWIWNLPGK